LSTFYGTLYELFTPIYYSNFFIIDPQQNLNGTDIIHNHVNLNKCLFPIKRNKFDKIFD